MDNSIAIDTALKAIAQLEVQLAEQSREIEKLRSERDGRTRRRFFTTNWR